LIRDSQINLPDTQTLDIVRQNIKHHSQQLSWETQEVKGQLLRTYIERIDIINDALTITFKIADPVQKMGIIYQRNLFIEI
jgi:hypothetical protein